MNIWPLTLIELGGYLPKNPFNWNIEEKKLFSFYKKNISTI